MVGASGAIAGVMGAYLMKFPRATSRRWSSSSSSSRTIDVPAFVLLLYWFAIQFFSGIGIGRLLGGIARRYWFAHVGGFLAGMAMILLPGQQRARPWRYRLTVARDKHWYRRPSKSRSTSSPSPPIPTMSSKPAAAR